jgi:hypothetical protein
MDRVVSQSEERPAARIESEIPIVAPGEGDVD